MSDATHGARVTIRLFARLKDIAGTGELIREAPSGATARTVWDTLVSEFSELAGYAGSVSVAVNEEYSRMDAPVAAGDEIAFLPPVSGG
ncbi:MAG: molybdopterin converting factor subunit 1 [Acidobacteria bacterium]|nr:molybdopterin converting factor subunit 1 [Acidobacteriota bacterium]